MSLTFRFARRPGWLAFQLVTVALSDAMALLGRRQLEVSFHSPYTTNRAQLAAADAEPDRAAGANGNGPR